MLQKKSLAIIYLKREGFTYFPQEGNSVSFSFPQDAVRELEVVNEELFAKEISNLISLNKITPATILIILSSEITYEKEFMDESQPQKSAVGSELPNQPIVPSSTVALEERARQIQYFIDTVPFEEIGSKTYKIEKGYKVIATNKRLYQMLKNQFEKQGFLCNSVIPQSMLDKELGAIGEMTQAVAAKVFSKFETVKQNSFMEENLNVLAPQHGIQMTTKVTSKREYMLIGVFGCLILVLGAVSYVTFFSSPPPPRKIAAIVVHNSPTPIASPTIIVSTTPVASVAALIKKESIKMQINGGTSLQADLLKQQLIKSGFTNIVTRPSTTPATGKALIVFSKTFPSSGRDVVIEEIKKNLLSVTVQENDVSGVDVVINL